MVDVFFINSLEEKFLIDTVNSFLLETKISNIENNFVIKIIEDKNKDVGRDRVLNNILSKRNYRNDLLIVSDDIIFTRGWLEALVRNLKNGDIIGFSMAKPGKKVYNNRGFEFVKVGNKITYIPISKGEEIKDIFDDGYRKCDAITGCLMYIKKDVLDTGIRFRKEGFNRWEELIFCVEAKHKGFNVIALNHVIYHLGISTKGKNVKLSSISYSVEKKLWDKVVKKYGKKMNIPEERMFTVVVDKELESILSSNSKKLIVGAGTVAEYLIDNVVCKNIDIASGLKEESGLLFKGIEIKNFFELKDELKLYDYIIITAVGYEDVFIDYLLEIDRKINKKIIYLKKILKQEEKKFLIEISKNSNIYKEVFWVD